MFILGVVVMLIGLLIALCSFKSDESTRVKLSNASNSPSDNFNIFAWPALADRSSDFVWEYIKKHFKAAEKVSSNDRQLYQKQIEQAIILAQITKKKDMKFNRALYCCLTGTVTTVIITAFIQVIG